MPKVDLRGPFWTEDGKLYRPGKGVEVPQAVADALAGKDSASSTQGGPGLTAGGGKAAGDDGGFDLENATKAEMMAEAERRGLTVERADGENGVPLVEDYRRALAQG